MKSQSSHAVVRTLLFSLAIIAATATVLLAGDLLVGKLSRNIYPTGIPAAPTELHAMTVRTQGNADFPSQPDLSVKELKKQLEEIVSFAAEYGYNAIYFEAAPNAEAMYRSSALPSGKFFFFDPLDYLVKICKEPEIQIYAVVDPFPAIASDAILAVKNPDWVQNGRLDPTRTEVQKLTGKIVSELTENYDIAGVVLSGVDSGVFDQVKDYAACLAKATGYARDGVKQKDSQRLGMVVNSDAVVVENARDLYSTPLKNGDLDFLVTSTGDEDPESLPDTLSAWKKICEEASSASRKVTFYPLHTAEDKTAFSHAIDDSLYFERQAGAGGIVISNYSALHTDSRIAAVSLAASFAQKKPAVTLDLSFGKTFTISRPTEPLTIRSDWSSYFITGTSDPALPAVTYQGKELPRSSGGLWGAFVNVQYGTNTYTFSQGGVNKTATIIRPQASGSSAINTIVKSSVYPANAEAVLPGTMLKLSCTAPAGGTVTATVGGLSATLQPVSPAQNGTAVTYQTTLDLSTVTVAGQVKNIGPVTYLLSYGGLNSSQQSAGEVYAAGTAPVVKMKTFVVPVNQNTADDGQYATILKKDCMDTILENSGGYYKLSMGGYVTKAAVEIPEGAVSAKNTVSSMAIKQVDKGEKLTLTGTSRPAFSGSMEQGRVVVNLYNLVGFEKMNTAKLESTLCSAIQSEIGENGRVTLTFQLKEGVKLLGWDVQFEGTDTVIYLKKRPAFHRDSAKPLSDVTVALDPGHGGTDPGAAGVPAEEGPFEKTFNLADAYAVQSRLEALGATVHILHHDATMTLNERMELSQDFDADLFISCHHNSTAENADASEVSGIEVYYYNDQSKLFAELAGRSLSEDSGRRLRLVEQSWYRVTMMTVCPAVLVESGFLVNPNEYESLTDSYAMFRYGNAIADAVIQYFAA